MKAFERIFLYSVLAILVFYVFLADNNAESQVAVQEEIRARRIAIVNDAGREVVRLWANKNGGLVNIGNKDGTFVAGVSTTEDGGGLISVSNKDSTPTAIIASNKEGAGIAVFNRYGTLGVEIIATEDDGGMIGVSKADAPGTVMGIYKDDGLIEVYNKHGDVIGRLP
ncbi:MAG: hypothetical protein MUO87_05475 [Thermoplasmata archaeon]|nr:hypothetical protein [Thermoplasmata archaeon]